MTVTKDQAQMLATLAVAARPTGAPRWDAPGVVAAIGNVRHLALSDVMRAVSYAAEDRGLKTPGAIGNITAPCWRTRTADDVRPAAVTREQRCGVCSKPRERCAIGRVADDDHSFEPDLRRDAGIDVAATVEALKAEVEPTREPTPKPTAEPERRPELDDVRREVAAEEGSDAA